MRYSDANRASRNHLWIRLAFIAYRRATRATETPGPRACAHIDRFSSPEQTRFYRLFFHAKAHLKIFTINGGHLSATPSARQSADTIRIRANSAPSPSGCPSPSRPNPSHVPSPKTAKDLSRSKNLSLTISVDGAVGAVCGPCVRREVMFAAPCSGTRGLTLYTHIVRYPRTMIIL